MHTFNRVSRRFMLNSYLYYIILYIGSIPLYSLVEPLGVEQVNADIFSIYAFKRAIQPARFNCQLVICFPWQLLKSNNISTHLYNPFNYAFCHAFSSTASSIALVVFSLIIFITPFIALNFRLITAYSLLYIDLLYFNQFIRYSSSFQFIA